MKTLYQSFQWNSIYKRNNDTQADQKYQLYGAWGLCFELYEQFQKYSLVIS